MKKVLKETEKGIEGNGSTNIVSGTTTNSGAIAQNTVSIADGATLNTDASELITSAGVTNAGTLQFTGGENANAITGGGTTQILGDVINNALISQTIDITSGSSLKTSADKTQQNLKLQAENLLMMLQALVM